MLPICGSAATRLFVAFGLLRARGVRLRRRFRQGSGGAVGPLAPNFDSIQANIFEPLCEHCHSGANAPVGLRLDAANSYALLVGVASGERPNILRVAPGDPNNSYLIQKLEGTAGVGERMPAGLPAVPQADINIIRQWITDGAQPSSSASGPIRVTSLSPAPNSTVLALPASITVGFNRELNAPSVTTATFTLQRAGPTRRSARPTTSRSRRRP